MKLETKILWLISLILIISSCDTINTNSRNSKANNVGTSTIITHPPSVDSLLKVTNKNQSMIKNVGSLLNLQLLRGYRGIMLGMPYDS